jgi:hypothetical protein
MIPDTRSSKAYSASVNGLVRKPPAPSYPFPGCAEACSRHRDQADRAFSFSQENSDFIQITISCNTSFFHRHFSSPGSPQSIISELNHGSKYPRPSAGRARGKSHTPGSAFNVSLRMPILTEESCLGSSPLRYLTLLDRGRHASRPAVAGSSACSTTQPKKEGVGARSKRVVGTTSN